MKIPQKDIASLAEYTAFLFQMNSKFKAVFLLSVFAVMAPYFGFVLYFVPKYPSGQLPVWLVDTMAIWLVANFLIIMLLIRRFSRGQTVDPVKVRIARSKSLGLSTRLVILWILLFLYGVKETIQGKIPLSRAVPAGVFLLIFIGLFGWGIYRVKRGEA
jgi:hypothetical protein